jgi:AcrR family transcriptional regulator
MTATQDTASRDEVRLGIVTAASRLLREEGANAVTTRAVAQAAGVQAPTIYRLFGDKNGLIDAVAEHVMATYVAAKSAVVQAAEGDPVADLRFGWRVHIEFGLANPELYALIAGRGTGGPSPRTATGHGRPVGCRRAARAHDDPCGRQRNRARPPGDTPAGA